MVPAAQSSRPIDPGVTIGHVHLRTADIDRVRGFYVDVLGFDVIMSRAERDAVETEAATLPLPGVEGRIVVRWGE